MKFWLASLLITNVVFLQVLGENYIAYSHSCSKFERSQELPTPRCQSSFWIFSCFYKYECNDYGGLQLTDCRRWEKHDEYPYCKDIYCKALKSEDEAKTMITAELEVPKGEVMAVSKSK